MTRPAGEVADQLLADLAPLDVTAAATIGSEPHIVMPRLAPEDFAARSDAQRRALAALDPADDSVLALVLRERLAGELALDDAGFTTALLASLATPVHAVRSAVESLPRDTADDWVRIGEHLRLVPAALDAYADTLRSAPRTVAARQVHGAATQCERWVGAEDVYGRITADHPELADAAATATLATRRFATFLREELMRRAPGRDAVGRDFYAVTARSFLGEDVDLDETYAFGWSELASLTAQMQEIAARLGASGIDEAAAALDTDPARLLPTERLVPWLDERLARTVEAIDGVHVDLPPQARVPQVRLAPGAVGVMYYAPPDPSLTRPGTVWWAPPADGHVSTWHEVTTVHHEGVPGHHLQIATALAEPGLHPYQRSMVHVHGYAEGWAHYAERLADEFGLIADDGERLGMLFGQRWRAARIVIDLGLHLDLPIPAGTGFTDATRWSTAVGREVLIRAARCDEATARFEVERYLGWPAQALAFRVGARLWNDIRARAEAAPGFDARAFHMRALRLGPMGLGPLRQVLA